MHSENAYSWLLYLSSHILEEQQVSQQDLPDFKLAYPKKDIVFLSLTLCSQP